jgi:hypothetical protein
MKPQETKKTTNFQKKKKNKNFQENKKLFNLECTFNMYCTQFKIIAEFYKIKNLRPKLMSILPALAKPKKVL